MTDPYLDLGHTVEEPDEVVAAYEKLEHNLDELAATPTQTAFDAERRQRRRGQKFILALLVLAILVGYLLTAIVAQNVGRQAARTELLDSTVASLVAANQVRETQGLPPIPIDDVVSQLNDQGIVQAVTAAVLSQIEGDPRFRGPAGSDGLQGAAGQPGQAGTNGEPGTNGASGSPGVDGQPGADGPQGPQGAQGAEGAQGPQGIQGPPPNSFTINGQTCTRIGDTADYECVIGP